MYLNSIKSSTINYYPASIDSSTKRYLVVLSILPKYVLRALGNIMKNNTKIMRAILCHNIIDNSAKRYLMVL